MPLVGPIMSVGEWTDDTSGASLSVISFRKKFDADDIMKNFISGLKKENIAHSKCFDIGNTVYDALSSYNESIKYNQFQQSYRGRLQRYIWKWCFNEDGASNNRCKRQRRGYKVSNTANAFNPRPIMCTVFCYACRRTFFREISIKIF